MIFTPRKFQPWTQLSSHLKKSHKQKPEQIWWSGSVCSWGSGAVHVPGVEQMPVFAQHPLCSAWQPAGEERGQGEIWVLGKYTGPCCIHWIALILLSVSFYFCHPAFCLPVGSTYWAAGRLVGAMGRCNFVAGQSTPRSSQGH